MSKKNATQNFTIRQVAAFNALWVIDHVLVVMQDSLMLSKGGNEDDIAKGSPNSTMWRNIIEYMLFCHGEDAHCLSVLPLLKLLSEFNACKEKNPLKR